ncbi:hypothetical protein [Azospirillum melinis]
MQTFEGKTVLVLEQNAVLRLGVEALLESWQCNVIASDELDCILAAIKEQGLRPCLMLLPPTHGELTGDQLADIIEAEIGYRPPWIGITADLDLIERWKAGAVGGTLLEMPCFPETLSAAMLRAVGRT